MMTSELITVKNLSHIYEKTTIKGFTGQRNVQALKDISFSLKQNTINLFLGPSGAGKSTLFSILGTRLLPTTGEYFYKNQEPFALQIDLLQKFRWRDIGVVNQVLQNNFLYEYSFVKNVSVLKSNSEMSWCLNELNNEFYEKLEFLGLTKRHLKLPVGILSGGEQQRLALLFLYIKNPCTFILDEPTCFLDPSNRDKVLQFLHELKKDGKDIIVATHDQSFIPIADSIFVIEDGRLKSKDIVRAVIRQVNSGYKIEGIRPFSNKRLELPSIVYQQLNKNEIYQFELVNKHPLSLRLQQITKTRFKEKDYNSWVYITEESIEIPEKFKYLPWTEKNHYWQFEEDGVLLIFYD